MAILYGQGIESLSVGGRQYMAGVDGEFDVPDECVPVLLEHGLVRSSPPPLPLAPCPGCIALRAQVEELEQQLTAPPERVAEPKKKGK